MNVYAIEVSGSISISYLPIKLVSITFRRTFRLSAGSSERNNLRCGRGRGGSVPGQVL